MSSVTEVVSGVDEVHVLDIKCFTHLNALLESPMVPTVILNSWLVEGLKPSLCSLFFTPIYALQLLTLYCDMLSSTKDSISPKQTRNVDDIKILTSGGSGMPQLSTLPSKY